MMIQNILFIITGFAFLMIGGEILVKNAVKIARYFQLSEILVSAVIVGFGLS